MPEEPKPNELLLSLPEAVRRPLNQIVSGEFLGASRNIRQINDLFVLLAETSNSTSTVELLRTLQSLGDYLCETRGKNTPVIRNAIQLFLGGLALSSAADLESARRAVASRRDEFNFESLANASKIAENGSHLLRACRAIMAFDYSSSVMNILKALAGQGEFKRIVVPESRILDGGRPIAREASECGHRVDYIVDMAFWQFLPQVDAVMVGAEAFMANGDCRTTIGSYAIAALARPLGIPFYVPTELLKIDPDSFAGGGRVVQSVDASHLLNYPAAFAHPERVSVAMPDLDNVPAELITAYITPDGIVPPAELRAQAAAFLGPARLQVTS